MAASKINVKALLGMNLEIPPYQRPYKWTKQNVEELLTDISQAIEESQKLPEDYKYRIGTILLYNNPQKDAKEIVDGQQRIITLVLINLFLDPLFTCSIMEKSFSDKISQQNIHDNYFAIKQWFALKTDKERMLFVKAFENILEVIIIEVEEQSEAFQLFDSQNSRGKSLYPHDLLKAYHLREMNANLLEMEHTVMKWENKDPKDIRALFSDYLFAVCNWSRCRKTSSFRDKDIDMFKGTDLKHSYTYSMRAFRSSPYFQINEPFLSGADFFMYVEHYLQLLDDLKRMLSSSLDYTDIMKILRNPEKWSTGFEYCKKLFYCVLLCYYDRFHSLDKMAVYRLFTWAFMIRVDIGHLGFDTINLYAIGDGNHGYTNQIPMFSQIINARRHTDIANLTIKCKMNDGNWDQLAKQLMEINGR